MSQYNSIVPGVCGCGFMGKNHIRNYLKQDDIKSIYVYDINRSIFKSDEYLKSISDKIIQTSSLKDLRSKANLISVCSPSEYHYQNMLELYDKSNFYLEEKPLFLEEREFKDFKRTYPECIKNIKCGYIERYNPTVNELIKVIDDIPTYVEFKRFNPASKRISGAIEYDLSIHDANLLNYIVVGLCNKFKIDSYDDTCYISKNISKDHAVYLIDVYIGGKFFLSNIATSRGAMKKVRQIYIETEKKTYITNLLAHEIEIISKKEGNLYSHDGNIYTEEYETIIKNINGEESLYLELKDIIQLAKKYLEIGEVEKEKEVFMQLQNDYDMSCELCTYLGIEW